MWNRVLVHHVAVVLSSLLLLLFLNSAPHLAMSPPPKKVKISHNHQQIIQDLVRTLNGTVMFQKKLLEGTLKLQPLLNQEYITYGSDVEKEQLRLFLVMLHVQISPATRYVTYLNQGVEHTKLETAVKGLEKQLEHQWPRLPQPQPDPRLVMVLVLQVIQRGQPLQRNDLLTLTTAVLNLVPEVQEDELIRTILLVGSRYWENRKWLQPLQNLHSLLPNSEYAGNSPDTTHFTRIEDLRNALRSENDPPGIDLHNDNP